MKFFKRVILCVQVTVLFLILQCPPAFTQTYSSEDLTVEYASTGLGSNALTSKEVQQIRKQFAQYHQYYSSAVLYINCYPAKNLPNGHTTANYQIVITCMDGCILESERMYTAPCKLSRSILKKVHRAFSTWHSRNKKGLLHVAKISNF